MEPSNDEKYVQAVNHEAVVRGAGLYAGLRQFARYVARVFLLVFVLAWLVQAVANHFGWGTDDTDFNGWSRSGLRLHTDWGTGVQYLSTPEGGLIVRQPRQTTTE